MTTSLFERFQRKFGSYIDTKDTPFVLQALEDAGNAVCDLIGRDKVPERLVDVQLELAIIAFNKRGAEGESSRSEGGISRSFEALPPLMLKRLNNYPRKVGVIRAINDEGPVEDDAEEGGSEAE